MDNGTIKMTQPKLLKKLFISQYPPMSNERGNRKRKHIHPYGPTPNGNEPAATSIDPSKYLRLLGMLMYLTKSRPDIMAAVSFAAIVMEDNSAVITVTIDDSAFAKKCKHFLMIINYVREQVELGIVSIEKIAGASNKADLHTTHVGNIMGGETEADKNRLRWCGGYKSFLYNILGDIQGELTTCHEFDRRYKQTLHTSKLSTRRTYNVSRDRPTLQVDLTHAVQIILLEERSYNPTVYTMLI